MLHSLAISRQVMGMFCGLLRREVAPAQEVAFSLLSMLLGGSADALATQRRTRQLTGKIEALENLLPFAPGAKRSATTADIGTRSRNTSPPTPARRSPTASAPNAKPKCSATGEPWSHRPNRFPARDEGREVLACFDFGGKTQNGPHQVVLFFSNFSRRLSKVAIFSSKSFRVCWLPNNRATQS